MRELRNIHVDRTRNSAFDRPDLLQNLKSKSIKGGAAVGIGQGCIFLLQFGSVMILARLLSPGDFGLIALTASVTRFATMFKDAGLSMAAVQREKLTEAQASNLFWINLALGLLVAVAVALSGPFVARFFKEPRLVGVTSALATTFFFSGLTVQHQALLKRRMQFATLTCIQVASLVISIAVACTAAWLGAEYWALVSLTIVNVICTMVLTWINCRWTPGRPSKGSGARSLLAFGGNMTLFNFVNYFVRNLDNLLIGHAFGITALGYYSNAYRLLLLPIQQISRPIATVAVPALSRLQSDSKRFRSYYCRGIRIVTSFGMPAVAFSFLMANEIVFLGLGSDWTPTVPIFRALAPAAFLGTFNVASSWIFIPLDQTDRQLRIGTILSIAVVASFLIGLSYGPIGVATAFSICVVVSRVPALIYTVAKSPISVSDIAKAVGVPAIGSVLAAFFTWYIYAQFVPPKNPITALVWAGISFVVLYATLYALLNKAQLWFKPELN